MDDVFFFFCGKQENTSQMRWPCHPPTPASISPPPSPSYSLHLSPLWEIMWLFDLPRDEWQWFSQSSPVSITLTVKYQPQECVCVCECVSVQVCMCPVLPITPLGSVTPWQKALIFQFYHTPLSRVSPSCSRPYHPLSFFFSYRPIMHTPRPPIDQSPNLPPGPRMDRNVQQHLSLKYQWTPETHTAVGA